MNEWANKWMNDQTSGISFEPRKLHSALISEWKIASKFQLDSTERAKKDLSIKTNQNSVAQLVKKRWQEREKMTKTEGNGIYHSVSENRIHGTLPLNCPCPYPTTMPLHCPCPYASNLPLYGPCPLFSIIFTWFLLWLWEQF